MTSSLPRALPALVVIALGGCAAAPRGLGAVHIPQRILDGSSRKVAQVQATLSGGASSSGGGVGQLKISSTLYTARWFGIEIGAVVTGLGDPALDALSEAQDSSDLWGVLPFAAPTFVIGPVHIRLVLFGFGGGGPEGPAGMIGIAGGSVGYHGDRWALYAGGTAFGTFGCCEGEYQSLVVMAPVGASFDLPTGWKRADLSVDVEAMYTYIHAGFRQTRDRFHGGTVLVGLTLSGH